MDLNLLAVIVVVIEFGVAVLECSCTANNHQVVDSEYSP